MRRSIALLYVALMGLVFPLLLAAGDGPPTDDVIYDRVRLKLASDPDVRGGTLEVQVQNGVVTLSGGVQTEKARQKAERLARKVKGVKQVVNRLEVKP